MLRGDSGFCREEIMHWCEAHQVDYVLGLAKNSRLIEAIAPELEQARREHERTGEPTAPRPSNYPDSTTLDNLVTHAG